MPINLEQAATGSSPGGDFFAEEDDDPDKIKPWDKFFQTEPPEIDPSEVPEEWTLLHGGRSIQDGLIASAAELVSDLLWGNLALPINKCLEKMERIEKGKGGSDFNPLHGKTGTGGAGLTKRKKGG